MTVFHLIVIAIITVTVVAIGWWIVTTITIILDGYSNAAFAVCVCVISISIACAAEEPPRNRSRDQCQESRCTLSLDNSDFLRR